MPVFNEAEPFMFPWHLFSPNFKDTRFSSMNEQCYKKGTSEVIDGLNIPFHPLEKMFIHKVVF